MAAAQLKSPVQLFKVSSDRVRNNVGLFLTLSVLTIIDTAWQVGTALRDKTNGADWGGVIKNSLFGTDSSYPSWGGGFITFLFFLATIILSLMMVITVVRAAQAKKVSLEHVWNDFQKYWLRLIGVMILTVLLIGASFLLLIIPGIFVLPRLVFAPYLLIDQDCGVMEALNRSWDMTKGYFGAIWFVILFGILLSLPSVVPVVGQPVAFVLTLLYSVAMPLRYFEVKKHAV